MHYSPQCGGAGMEGVSTGPVNNPFSSFAPTNGTSPNVLPTRSCSRPRHANSGGPIPTLAFSANRLAPPTVVPVKATTLALRADSAAELALQW